ncbi:hypothetical protein [Aegicerativicinus sediminis]|uniref:hypothetical protein n=1 Tax=Aegicerativicinus sediminis TaxID=2893202 RepID=UPI001E2DD897|nr:hypothetical protein [Aegicerativicinus sediminis]
MEETFLTIFRQQVDHTPFKENRSLSLLDKLLESKKSNAANKYFQIKSKKDILRLWKSNVKKLDRQQKLSADYSLKPWLDPSWINSLINKLACSGLQNNWNLPAELRKDIDVDPTSNRGYIDIHKINFFSQANNAVKEYESLRRLREYELTRAFYDLSDSYNLISQALIFEDNGDVEFTYWGGLWFRELGNGTFNDFLNSIYKFETAFTALQKVVQLIKKINKAILRFVLNKKTFFHRHHSFHFKNLDDYHDSVLSIA